MRCAETVLVPLALLLPVVLSACGGGDTSRERQAPPAAAAVEENGRRAEAMRQIDALQAAVDKARAAVEAAASAPRLPRERQLRLSETRRAIVVANVSLQKARTAFVQGDYAGVGRETAAAAARLAATEK